MNVDGNGNMISVENTSLTRDGLPLAVARLHADPAHGYVVSCEEDGGFGDADCPSSCGRPCLAWFGPGERYADAASALADLQD